MADMSTLLTRIDAEFSALDAKVKRAQSEKQHEHKDRQQRLAAFEKEMQTLPDVWKPRLEALIQRFGDKAKVTPRLESTSRAVTVHFQSELAKIQLRFSAATDQDVRRLILLYHLEILPTLMEFESHAQAEWPLEAIDRKAIGQWVDDRIVSFVKTYLSLHENEYYLKEHMVSDPVAGVRFPKFAAAATFEYEGKTYYFIGEDTRREFEASHRSSSAGAVV
jgi:YHS domain-containing protein